MADHVQGCWEVKKGQRNGHWLRVLLCLGDLSQTFSARKGRHLCGAGVKDVKSVGVDSLMKGLVSRLGEQWGEAGGHVKLEVGVCVSGVYMRMGMVPAGVRG